MWTWQQIKDFFKPTVPQPGKPIDRTVHQSFAPTKASVPSSEITSMVEMPIPQQGIELIKQFEDCKLKAYQDQKGVWSIGFGHTEGIKEGDVCTREQAEKWLAVDVMTAWKAVLRHVKVRLSSNELGALLSFTYNCGEGELEKSDVLKYVNSASNGYVPQALKEVCKVKVDGVYKVSMGLLARRVAEANLWTGADWRDIKKQ